MQALRNVPAEQALPVEHRSASDARARVLVFASLFPSGVQPGAGLFIRERMFRVGQVLPVVVVSPRPWFPLQGLLQRFKPGYRPLPAKHEVQQGVDVYFPRFLSLPVIGRFLDGFSMAVCSWALMRRLRKQFRYDVIDAHFAYPDGFAASLLGRWFATPVTITLRGTEVPLSKYRLRRKMMLRALAAAARVFSVADALKRHVTGLGAAGHKVRVVGNGVDTDKFQPVSRRQARVRFGLPQDAQVLITVGGLVPRKGFHRVIACLPELRRKSPNLHYLVVGGPSPEGNNEAQLKALADELGVADGVHFLGPVAPEELKWPLSAADVFVLSTSNEGWANVILEAMACGLPVVATDVGGNAEVVCAPHLGSIVPFGDHPALAAALEQALATDWDRDRIIQYARDNSWDSRVTVLVQELEQLRSPQAARTVV